MLNSQFVNQFNYAAGNYYPYYYPNYSTPYYPPAAYSPGYGYGNGYGYNYGSPVSPGVPATAGDPYGSGSLGSGYPGGSPGDNTPHTNPYGVNPYDPYGYGSFGQALKGVASINRSLGEQAISYEQARLMREQYNQNKLDTIKKKFDLDMYIKANTPTYTEEQARVAKLTLKRIQTNSLPGEVATGKALNYLLDDLRKYPNKKAAIEPMLLSEAVLSQLNVTKGTFGVGILREGGKFTWPAALAELVPPAKRRDIDAKVQALVKEGSREKGKLDTNMLRDVRDEMDAIKADLVQKVNDVPTAQYLDAKRFLQEFYEGTVALERGEAPVQAKFQRFIEGGKSIQDVVDYMITHGLRFASATAADEAAYRTFHANLASYDIALHAQIAQNARE